MFVVLAKTVFILSTVLFAYHHFVFPYVLQWMARRRDHAVPVRLAGTDDPGLPTVKVVVPAYQEEALIGDKVRNLAAIEYPRGRLEIVIALDGCTDKTAEIARQALDDVGNPGHVNLIENEHNQGKLAVLNDEIGKADADIIVLSDVSASVEPLALLRGVVHFQDEDVGVVCGTYKLKFPSNQGEEKYWSFQTRLKSYEAAVAAPMGAHGAFYLFRRKCWEPLPENTINDDFVLPMQIVEAGYRAVYDEDLIAWELERTKVGQEFGRRVRIGMGNMQQLVRFSGLLNPWRKPVRSGGVGSARLAFVFGSGKALRVLVPFVVIAGAVSCLSLAYLGYDMFGSIAVSGVVVSLLGLWGILGGNHVPKIVAWLGYLIEGHAATFMGAIGYLRGKQSVQWSGSAGREDYIPYGIRAAKRTFDVVFSVVALVLLWPLFIPIAIAVKLESAGPVFYRQRRVGRVWRHKTDVFELIKFRTMYEDAEARGAQWATKNDPRITRVGNFLRKTRLDELPQFLNVIAGEMSLIGPRPERPQLIGGLETQLPLYAERTYGLRPGITGLAQVNQGYDTSIDDVRRKLLFDHAYAAHLSSGFGWLKMDLKIIFSTLLVMATGRGQ